MIFFLLRLMDEMGDGEKSPNLSIRTISIGINETVSGNRMKFFILKKQKIKFKKNAVFGWNMEIPQKLRMK